MLDAASLDFPSAKHAAHAARIHGANSRETAIAQEHAGAGEIDPKRAPSQNAAAGQDAGAIHLQHVAALGVADQQVGVAHRVGARLRGKASAKAPSVLLVPHGGPRVRRPRAIERHAPLAGVDQAVAGQQILRAGVVLSREDRPGRYLPVPGRVGGKRRLP